MSRWVGLLVVACGLSLTSELSWVPSPFRPGQQPEKQLLSRREASPPMSLERTSVATEEPAPSWARAGVAAMAALAVLAGSAFATAPAAASDKRMVGEIPASGLIFKDTINVEEFDDPKVSGVSLYLSDFSRSITDRVAKGDFFSDPGAAGLTCVSKGKVLVSPDLKSNKEGEDVLTEARSLLFKTLKVKRLYDQEGQNIVYVVFTERVDTSNDSNKSRFKSQLCGVHVDGVQEAKK